MDLSHDRWTSASDRERTALAESLVRELPTGFVFRGVRTHELGSRRSAVAAFELRDSAFSFVPGGAVELGWDGSWWNPNDDELESFADSADEYGIEDALPAFVARMTRSRRTIVVPPLLVEVAACEAGWLEADPDDEACRKAVSQLEGKPGPYKVEIHQGSSIVRAVKTREGDVVCQRAEPTTHRDLVDRLGRDGFRFPTSDEWEHLCGGGATTLFRWGDHVPCDRYPTDISPAEAAWRREWVLSCGRLERPKEGFARDWDLHCRPNLYGLYIAQDPYKYELVAEADQTRGGDGGSTICGGAGFFLGWLTLATAYFEEHACRRQPDEPILSGFTIGRRVLPLS